MNPVQREVRRIVEKWRRILGIAPRWEFIITLYEAESETPKKRRGLAAWIKTESAYLRSYLHINLWQDEAVHDLESLVTHELLHVVTDRVDTTLRALMGKKLKGLHNEMVESLVEGLEQSFRAVRPKNNKKRRA